MMAVREGGSGPPNGPAPVRVALVAVGNELLYGETVDTNSAWLGRTLAEWGMTVVRGATVRDRVEEIEGALSAARAEAGLVVVTGGLGPTVDDVTRQALSRHLGVPLVVDEGVRAVVRRRYEAAGLDEAPGLSEGQALVPRGAIALANEHGTAPGILHERDGSTVVLLPGVPREMRSIVSGPLRAHLAERGALRARASHFVLHTTGIPESRLATLVEPRWHELPAAVRDGVGLAFLPDELGVDLRVTVAGMAPDDAMARFTAVEREIGPIVAPWRFEAASGDLAEAVSELLLRIGWTMVTAESCTGGLVAERMTELPGASRVFLGGVVAYENVVKTEVLGVSAEDLARDGAVSEVVAVQMATGALQRMGGDVAVSVTGIAGPGGGSPEKPVGTVWIAVGIEGRTVATRTRFGGDRGAIRRRAAQAALAHVHRRLVETDGGS